MHSEAVEVVFFMLIDVKMVIEYMSNSGKTEKKIKFVILEILFFSLKPENMPITDEEVCKILGNTNVKAYKYGNLKPKIDELIKQVANKLQIEHKKEIERIKNELIIAIKGVK